MHASQARKQVTSKHLQVKDTKELQKWQKDLAAHKRTLTRRRSTLARKAGEKVYSALARLDNVFDRLGPMEALLTQYQAPKKKQDSAALLQARPS